MLDRGKADHCCNSNRGSRGLLYRIEEIHWADIQGRSSEGTSDVRQAKTDFEKNRATSVYVARHPYSARTARDPDELNWAYAEVDSIRPARRSANEV